MAAAVTRLLAISWAMPPMAFPRAVQVSHLLRGLAALGYTMQRPEDDRYLLTQSELESRIQVLLGGTIAEEMVFWDGEHAGLSPSGAVVRSGDVRGRAAQAKLKR